MHVVSDLYKELLSKNARREVRLSFGDDRAEDGYDEKILISMRTNARVFANDTPEVGCCAAGEIEVEMLAPTKSIPRQCKMIPYIRLTDGIRTSEWIQKGVYYIDTRETKDGGSKNQRIVLRGYDDMLKAEQDYPQSSIDWPARDIDVVMEIANFMGIPVDDRTVAQMVHGYEIPYPSEYSCRETLGFIASMYAGCFIMSDIGSLLLITLNNIPRQHQYLVTEDGDAIMFGGVRILV